MNGEAGKNEHRGMVLLSMQHMDEAEGGGSATGELEE